QLVADGRERQGVHRKRRGRRAGEHPGPAVRVRVAVGPVPSSTRGALAGNVSTCTSRTPVLPRAGVRCIRVPERSRRSIGVDIEIGIGKTARRAYGFDEVAIVPSRRTRDPDDVDISWQIDAYRFELPLMASAMDGVVSPATAAEIGRLGGLAVLNLEGLWTRYEDPEPVLEEIAAAPGEKATLRMQEIYAEPIKEELVGRRIAEIKEAGVTS